MVPTAVLRHYASQVVLFGRLRPRRRVPECRPTFYRGCEPTRFHHQVSNTDVAPTGRTETGVCTIVTSGWLRFAAILLMVLTGRSALAANYSDAETLFLAGKIDQAKEIAEAEVERGIWNRRWSELLIRCQLATGQYEGALETYDAAIRRYPTSLPLRTLGIEVAHFNDLPDRAASEKAMIERYLQSGQLRYATSDTLIAAGRFFSESGIDARIILKNFYDRVLETDATNLEALIATAELAVSKGDFAVAAETVAKAQQRELQDARLDYLLAVALRSSDPPQSRLALARSLQENPVYEPALILKAEQEIDREQYDQAEATIDEILKTNPNSPSAFALKAVLAHLAGDYQKEKRHREKALQWWPTNPNVDHLIGRKLSDKYRFAEGAHYQRLALTFEPSHMPATFQLAQDLLRLGDDDVGWELAEQVNTEDPYNVVAYNLMTLKDRIDGFETIRASDPMETAHDVDTLLAGPGGEAQREPGEILIRMDPRERKVYGNAVAQLLTEAKQVLCEKYDLELTRPVIVEIFPKQSDFAIRTFGLPGGEGFLGVCFGRVITANSPASQGPRPSNWKSVLWHEFCHVITLTKTKNRMPRWLSEGISVYEELERDRRWGQSMTARYREMILGDDFTPVSQLSGAFLSPASPTHLQFAYYESSLVVRYLVETFGPEALNATLDSLAEGIPINQALAESIAPMERIESGFAQYARNLAEEFGSGLEFTRHDLPEDAPAHEILQWAEMNPNNYWARMTSARSALALNRYDAAAEQFEFLVEKNAATGEQEGVLESLAACYRELGNVAKERDTLKQLFSVSSDALPGLQRFIEMEKERNEWSSVLESAAQALEIQPFSQAVHQSLVTACRELGQSEKAINSLRALQAMDPVDVAGLNYQLAESLAAAGDVDAATRHLVDALLIAPRYRDAHHLLLKLHAPPKQTPIPAEPEGDTGSDPPGQSDPDESSESNDPATQANPAEQAPAEPAAKNELPATESKN
ncbi:tetratricopeptide repeat protein [Stieleria maiorica]|uniref:Tetratricopeptide repeat protein n=1 Tax=Stieleria maiorica TaxID=2795974 RepID=A0A5B9MI04_9BACT|nr:tetratricopeptide repeat protein [Stieleria maiorica]QEF99215.1 tetratricopeptide repeat protein [Stieleria maiorica]